MYCLLRRIILSATLASTMPSIALSQTTWTAQSSGVTDDLRDVSFTTTNAGVILADVGPVLYTTDGGMTWKRGRMPSASFPYGLDMLDARVGIMVTQRPDVLKTSDGGANWSAINDDPGATPLEVEYLDADLLVASGYDGSFLKSTNGGVSWSVTETPASLALMSISFLDPTNGFMTGVDGMILRTTNGGTSWTSQKQAFSNNVAVDFTDVNNGLAVSFEGRVLRTTNAGAAWTPVTSGTSENLLDIEYIDRDNVIAVGYNGTILRSSDGGASWRSEPSGTTEILSKIAIAEGAITIVGTNGTVLRGGGISSIDAPRSTVADIFSRLFPNPTDGVATIELVVDRPGSVTVRVLSMEGREIARRDGIALEAGMSRVSVPGADALAAGSYLVEVSSGAVVETHHFVIVPR